MSISTRALNIVATAVVIFSSFWIEQATAKLREDSHTSIETWMIEEMGKDWTIFQCGLSFFQTKKLPTNADCFSFSRALQRQMVGIEKQLNDATVNRMHERLLAILFDRANAAHW